ncbi:MAG: ferric reductase-like transmembrane domain-containing protein [Anaerolineae bacterium]|nr:ferric reductase-like transmembrane domain-containing protein [Anaerolineae bacterium]
MLDWLRRNWHRLLVHVIGVGLAIWLIVMYQFGDLALPERFVMLRTGMISLIFLAASFACTPISKLIGWRRLTLIRRPLGLYGFGFALAHLFVYAWLENALEWELIWRDLGERRAMLVGLIALLLLVPLAITSTTGWQRRLGKRWKMLHRLVYLAIPLAVAHFYLLDRDFKEVPLTFAIIVASLLILRLPLVKLASHSRIVKNVKIHSK